MEVAGPECQGPALTALGSLFKLTEIHLWDDGSAEARDRSSFQADTKAADDDVDGKDSNVLSTSKDYGVLPEDEELTRQMKTLGLPLSFNTNKEKRNGRTKGKRKGMRQKQTYTCQGTSGEAVESTEASMAGADIYQQSSHDRDNPASLSEILCSSGKEQNDAGILCIDCTDHQDSVSEHSNVEIKDHMGNAVNSTSSETGLSSGSCLTDIVTEHGRTEQGDGKKECNCVEASSSALHEAPYEIICEGNVTEKLEVPKSAACSSRTLVLNGTETYECSGDFGDWMVCWDSYYSRNYFYNNKTQTSTWYPPEGMEPLTNCDNECNLNEIVSELTEMEASPATNAPDVCMLQNNVPLYKESVHNNVLLGQVYDEILDGVGLTACNYLSALNPLPVTLSRNIEDLDEFSETNGGGNGNMECLLSGCTYSGTGIPAIPLDTQHGPYITKREKKVRKTKNRGKVCNEKEAYKFQDLAEFADGMGKYWCQRYLLFSRYDDGIKMDEEGWFSVTPEALARHHAFRCCSGTIVDAFTGVGGNAIQFAQRCKHVTAVDIDPKKIGYAHHNATIYGVNDQIDFVKGDFFPFGSKVEDTVFLSPPWGGPDYLKVETYDIKTMLKPHDGYFLFNTAKKIASKVVMFLPRNVDLNQLAELSLLSSPPWSLEVEKNFVNGKLKAITAYFRDMAITGNLNNSTLYHEKGWWTFCEY